MWTNINLVRLSYRLCNMHTFKDYAVITKIHYLNGGSFMCKSSQWVVFNVTNSLNRAGII